MAPVAGLGNRLRQAREWSGFSQQEAADAIGVAREVISYWEHEHRTPGLAQLSRLADAFGITTHHLLEGEAPPNRAEEQGVLFRGIDASATRTRAEIRRWLAFLDDWADLREECGEELPGPSGPAKPAWRDFQSITDSRRGPTLAAQVREHYDLGSDAIPALESFLDSLGILVYRVPLDPLDDGGISGAFYNHPRLGACILVNTQTTPGRQLFTLAHEFGHCLFHYRERGVVSRAGSSDPKERFADAFACHLLVPTETLRTLVRRECGERISDPLQVIHLQGYFRVSYAMLLYRLLSEGLLDQEQYQSYKEFSPQHLALRLGLDTGDYQHQPEAWGITLATYPASVLSRIRSLIEAEELSPAAAASLLRVPRDLILEQLLASPVQAAPMERREFEELPDPPRPRARRKLQEAMG